MTSGLSQETTLLKLDFVSFTKIDLLDAFEAGWRIGASRPGMSAVERRESCELFMHMFHALQLEARAERGDN